MILMVKRWCVAVLLGIACSLGTQAADVGVPLWKGLTTQQQQVLAPLAAEWDGYTARGRKRLVALADRYPKLKPDEQARVAVRLKAWASLSRQERDKARENFRKVRKLPPEKQAEVKQKLQAERDAKKRHEAQVHPGKHLAVPPADRPQTAEAPPKPPVATPAAVPAVPVTQ